MAGRGPDRDATHLGEKKLYRDLDERDKRRIVKLFHAGEGRNAIVRRLQIHPKAVTRVVREAGLSYDTSNTREANKAYLARVEERRLELAERMLARAEAVLDRLEDTNYAAIMKGMGGRDTVRKLGFVPAAEERAMANALGSLTRAIAVLSEKKDRDHSTEAQSLLEDLAKSMGLTDREDAEKEK